MKKESIGARRACKPDRCGFTIPEVIIFMTLAISVMAGIILLISQSQRMNHAAEERFAAFIFCKTELETYRSTPFAELTDDFTETSSGIWQKEVLDVGFHTKSNPNRTVISGTETVVLTENRTASNIDFYQIGIEMEWTSAVHKGHMLTESVVAEIYE